MVSSTTAAETMAEGASVSWPSARKFLKEAMSIAALRIWTLLPLWPPFLGLGQNMRMGWRLKN